MSSIFPIFGCGLLCLAVAAKAFRLRQYSMKGRIATMLAAAVAVFAPFGDLSAAAHVRGITGDPSITTLVLACAACGAQLSGRSPIGPCDLRALHWLAACAALFLYPFALGWTPFDSYALGYGSIGFVAGLLLVALAAWRLRMNLVVLAVTAAAFAFLFGAYESRNLWDYLIDPLVALYAAICLLSWALRPRTGDVENAKTGAA